MQLPEPKPPSEQRLGWLIMMSCWVHWCASPVSIKEGIPAGDGDVASQHLEGGGFTGPVDPQQPETLSDTAGGVN